MSDEARTIDVSGGAERLSVEPGSKVRGPGGNVYQIEDVVDGEAVFARPVKEGDSLKEGQRRTLARLKTSELKPHDNEEAEGGGRKRRDLAGLSEKEAEKVRKKLEATAPLRRMASRTRDDVKKRAEEIGSSVTTLYRWIRELKKYGAAGGLSRKPRQDKGVGRLSEKQELAIESAIKDLYLTRERNPPSAVYEEVQRQCRLLGVEEPHENTVRGRLKEIDDREAMKERHGSKAARDAFHITEESFTADRPLEMVQIDHSPLDIQVVSQEDRTVRIGRPRITVALDVHTRMICGFYIGMHDPSGLSVALCLSRSIRPKEPFLKQLGMEDASWPVAGFPETIHLDNAKEFGSKALTRGCREHNIDVMYRQVATPHLGGHVERVIQTINDKIHELRGTTFGSVEERGNYDSEGRACFTLPALRRWITNLIARDYHQREHSALGTSPIQKWNRAVSSSGASPEEGALASLGAPARPTNHEKIALDFMPMKTPTIQDYGIVWKYLEYYHPVLAEWKEAKGAGEKKRKLVAKRDPRDISVIWVLDPVTKDKYHEIPWREEKLPPSIKPGDGPVSPEKTVSKWEYNRGVEEAHETYDDLDMEKVFKAITKRREIEREERRKTKAARKKARHQRGKEQKQRARKNREERSKSENIKRAAGDDQPPQGPAAGEENGTAEPSGEPSSDGAAAEEIPEIEGFAPDEF
jgi:putative transposase